MHNYSLYACVSVCVFELIVDIFNGSHTHTHSETHTRSANHIYGMRTLSYGKQNCTRAHMGVCMRTYAHAHARAHARTHTRRQQYIAIKARAHTFFCGVCECARGSRMYFGWRVYHIIAYRTASMGVCVCWSTLACVYNMRERAVHVK